MNKTIIININGTVFHIEEGAYELLKEYMTEVKRHFFNSADSLEITTDIENRIAEMFTDILNRENRQALVDQDVKYVIEQMGSVEDFETFTDEDPAYQANTYSHKNTTGQRRLFRDADDHLIGGVCAGIANYFDAPATWIRLAFALAFAFAGTGLFLYIILWIILPKAVTRADRMAMKGEPLDLQGFKRSFEAEMSMVGGRLSDLHQEARPLIYKTRDFVGDFFHHLGKFLGGTGKILVKLCALAIILGCAAGIIATIISVVLAWAFGDKSHFSVPDVFFNYRYIDQVYAAFALVAIIPLAALIILVARAAFNTLSFSRGTGYTLLIVWIFSFVVLAYHGARVASDFRESAGFTQTINLKPVKNQTYRLMLNEIMYLTPEDSARLDIKNRFKNVTLIDDENENFEPNHVRIDIEKADVSYPVLVEEFSARGRDYESALTHARNVRYIFTQQDSVLKFDYKIRRPAGEQWHNESVRLILKLPLHASVIIDDKVNRYITNMMDIYDCNMLNGRESGAAIFAMTDSGMQCKVDTTLAAKARSLAAAKKDTVVADTLRADTPVKATPKK
ncbi:PspC domain-containing protein [Mucilaginibacter sp. Bleaf8]|uniref:PspC domain-containing protein n=1 Tax=Mucilaginibacter sp. Bleaf8 TaxID=2834430 RepID=UPI001BCE65F5|nr:PspC domain-containing protein [Mucilaginibacter sp. Bleaf8]MBS7564376.1 PspC domain-containing protein [Mucilaginibacter sp. Bleaf8]